MCVPTDNPRRRHRPAYLAPSRAHDRLLDAPAAPLLAPVDLVPELEGANLFDTTPPPGTAPEVTTTSTTIPPKPRSIWSLCGMLLRGILDLALLVGITCAGFFLYDVEIKLVNEDETTDAASIGSIAATSVASAPTGQQRRQQYYHRRRPSDIHVGGRVVLRNDLPPPPPQYQPSMTTRRGVEDGIV